MSGPAKFWLALILLAVAGGLALRRGGGEPGVEPERPATIAPAARAETPARASAAVAPVSERGRGAAEASTSYGSVTIADAVTSIQNRGPAVAVFFASSCPISQRTVPQLARLAREEADGVTFVGYAVDSEEDPDRLADFLDRSGVGFETGLLQDWAPGEFVGEIRRFGIVIPDPWTRPLVVVVGEDGQALAAWNGMGDVAPLAELLREAGSKQGS